MTYSDYMKYIKFACDEELERMSEFLYGLDNNCDQSEDKYYVKYPHSNCPPDFDDVVVALAGRDMAADFALIDSDWQPGNGKLTDREQLYETIRELILV
jgi:hypothetical protein